MAQWTFGRKLSVGFAVMVVLALFVSGAAVYALRAVVHEKDRVIAIYDENLLDAQQLETASSQRMAANRGYFLTKNDLYLRHRDASIQLFADTFQRIWSRSTPEERSTFLAKMKELSEVQNEAGNRVIAMRRDGAPLEDVVKAFPIEIVPKIEALLAAVKEFKEHQRAEKEKAASRAEELAASNVRIVIGIAIAAMIIAAIIAYALASALNRQIGSAVQHIESSATELQAATNQQTTGTQEQVASMNEVSTTIKELLATAKQIAESAQRVVDIAEQTAAAAHAGDGTVQKAQTDVAGIRQQVDQIVTHMLDLGRKSHQIGGILEIINELSEQTNILAINATIEAVGAGDAGRRFSVVADEIRKLADRVGGSTREIRTLIDEIRAAVNTTVMATETGSKAVDSGVRQFSEVAGAFRGIVNLLGTTTEAAREIELSTKQQSTAVEQVNLAVANVTQAARESEATSSQVLQTVAELTLLSRELARLVRSASSNGRGYSGRTALEDHVR